MTDHSHTCTECGAKTPCPGGEDPQACTGSDGDGRCPACARYRFDMIAIDQLKAARNVAIDNMVRETYLSIDHSFGHEGRSVPVLGCRSCYPSKKPAVPHDCPHCECIEEAPYFRCCYCEGESE